MHRLLWFVVFASCVGSPDVTDPDPRDTAATSTPVLPTTSNGTGTDTGATPIVTDPLHGLPTGDAQWSDLCARGRADTIAQAFCSGDLPPEIRSLSDLRTLVGLGGDDILESDLRLSVVHHSTAVGGRDVTPLNPRAILLTSPRGRRENPTEPQPDERYTLLAFARGEPLVELAAKDPETEQPRFYLFRFSPACESTPDGCSLADRFTAGIESGWTDWSLYDDGDVKDTTLDCLRCHQPEGPGTDRLLLMQELRNPWNHWFYEEVSPNIAAIRAFEAAHGDTRYADLPVAVFTRSRPRHLQILIQNNIGPDQPNEYDSEAVNEELEESATSPTWDALYEASASGTAKPVPYAGNPHVDGNWDYTTPYQPSLDPKSPVAAAIDGYRNVVAGSAPEADMPDFRDLWLPEALVATSYSAPADLDGRALLRLMCAQCHNAATDPGLLRARFDVDALDTMPDDTKQRAIARLRMPAEDIRSMPPVRFHHPTQAERDLMVAELER